MQKMTTGQNNNNNKKTKIPNIPKQHNKDALASEVLRNQYLVE